MSTATHPPLVTLKLTLTNVWTKMNINPTNDRCRSIYLSYVDLGTALSNYALSLPQNSSLGYVVREVSHTTSTLVLRGLSLSLSLS